MNTSLENIYKDHQVKPYISPDRDIEAWLQNPKPAPKHLETLVEKGYAIIETAFDSLDHLNSTMKKNILKKKGVTGLSKMKASDLNQALHEHFSEEELASLFSIRGYKLTPNGEQALKDHQAIIDRHPKKNL